MIKDIIVNLSVNENGSVVGTYAVSGRHHLQAHLPSQDLLIIRRNHETGMVSLDRSRWGLIPHWCQDPKGGRRPINAVPSGRIVLRATVAHIHAFDNAVVQRPATLNDPPAHNTNIVTDFIMTA